MPDEPVICPHARPVGAMCPHCMGVVGSSPVLTSQEQQYGRLLAENIGLKAKVEELERGFADYVNLNCPRCGRMRVEHPGTHSDLHCEKCGLHGDEFDEYIPHTNDRDRWKLEAETHKARDAWSRDCDDLRAKLAEAEKEQTILRELNYQHMADPEAGRMLVAGRDTAREDARQLAEALRDIARTRDDDLPQDEWLLNHDMAIDNGRALLTHHDDLEAGDAYDSVKRCWREGQGKLSAAQARADRLEKMLKDIEGLAIYLAAPDIAEACRTALAADPPAPRETT